MVAWGQEEEKKGEFTKVHEDTFGSHGYVTYIDHRDNLGSVYIYTYIKDNKLILNIIKFAVYKLYLNESIFKICF